MDAGTPVQQQITREIKREKFITHRSWGKNPMGLKGPAMWERGQGRAQKEREIGPGARASIRAYGWSALAFLGEGQIDQCKGKSSLLVHSSGVLSKGTQEEGHMRDRGG